MSFHTWTNYGYGICVDNIGVQYDANRERVVTDITLPEVRKMLNLAPVYAAECEKNIAFVEKAMKDDKISMNEDVLKYLDSSFNDTSEYGETGLAQLILNIANEMAEKRFNIKELFVWFDDFDGAQYVAFTPCYPWQMRHGEQNVTKEQIEELFNEITMALVSIPATVAFQEAENGG